MATAEQIEKVRQAIMRYRELLDLLRGHLETGERQYATFFADLSDEDRMLPEKDRQREAALRALEDLEPLRRAALHMHFEMRQMEREFEQLYGHIAPEDPE